MDPDSLKAEIFDNRPATAQQQQNTQEFKEVFANSNSNGQNENDNEHESYNENDENEENNEHTGNASQEMHDANANNVHSGHEHMPANGKLNKN